jgi:spermidine synthase
MLYWLFLLSGGAGLALEVTWSRQLTVALGHEVTAVFATVSSLFGGMALGAALFGSRIRRSDRPEWWYAGLEGVIGLWAILASAGLTPVMLALGAMLGPDPSPLLQGTIHFLAPSVLLLPATAAMGAALPAMESLARRRLHESPIGLVYGWNTLGAVLGVWIATFFLMPLFPLHRLLLGIGAANFLVMGLVLVGTRGRPGIPATERIQPAGRRSTWVGLCLAGFLGISYELAGIRVLSQTLENTVYTFGATVAIFLAGTTMGAFAWHRWRSRLPPARLEPALWIGLSFAVLAGALVLTGIPSAYPWLRERLGDTSLAVFLAETASTGAVFLVPTLFMGALFSQLVEAGTAHGVGWGYAWNNAGAALAAPVTIFLFIPLLGCKGTLAVVAAAYAVPLIGRPLGWACLGLVGLAFLLPWDLRGLNPPPGGSLLAYREGGLASVAVLEQPGGDRTLRVNNRFQM